MNAAMKEKLRLACADAADLFELEPATFCTYAYARQDGRALDVGLCGVTTGGNSFCAVGAISYLSGCMRLEAASFLMPSIKTVTGCYSSPEDFNNGMGREAVIGLLRKAAIRTDVELAENV